ncbi:MAG: hypothetical protein DCC50_14200, partial [Acidobacteria bacterium]
MSQLQVVLDGRGAGPEELAAASASLLAQVEGPLLDATATLRPDVPLLVVPGHVVLARGAVRRLLSDLATPGRCLTCVVAPGSATLTRVTAWAPRWLAHWPGTLADLVDADLAFDREHLPTGSPVARAWLRADAVGVAAAADVGPDPAGWARRTGLLLDRDAAVA